MGLFGWLAYGVSSSIARSLRAEDRRPAGGPVRTGTEDDFRRDEERFAEDEKRLNEADAAERASK